MVIYLHFLRKNGIDVRLIDGLNLNISNDEIVDLVKDYQIVGITCLTDFYLQTVDLSLKLKEKGKIVVLGNVHPSIMPYETLNDTGADYIVCGEGELTMLDLVKSLKNGTEVNKIPGLIYRGQINFIKRDLIKELDELPMPDWEQMDPRKYRKAPHGALIKNFPVAPVVTTRGCPYNCSFCSSPNFWGRSLRYRTPERVIEEIEYLIRDFGVKEIHFEDDNLTMDRDHIVGICDLILKKGLNFSWATPNGVRADRVDEELLKLMKRAGCYYIAFGIESGNQDILNNIKKRETLADIEKSVRLANKTGMMTQGFFILGLPGETEQTIKNSIAFAKRIPLDRAQFLILDLLPGSELWQKHNKEYHLNYNNKSYHEPTWIPGTITREALIKWQPRAFRQFFFVHVHYYQ